MSEQRTWKEREELLAEMRRRPGRVVVDGAERSLRWLDTADARTGAWRGAVFENIRLRGSKLRGADLRRCAFWGCVLENVDLSRANMESSRFEGCLIVGSDLTGAFLWDAVFRRCVLRSVQLDDAALTFARLIDVEAQRSSFVSADMEQAALFGVQLGAAFQPSSAQHLLVDATTATLSNWSVGDIARLIQQGVVLDPRSWNGDGRLERLLKELSNTRLPSWWPKWSAIEEIPEEDEDPFPYVDDAVWAHPGAEDYFLSSWSPTGPDGVASAQDDDDYYYDYYDWDDVPEFTGEARSDVVIDPPNAMDAILAELAAGTGSLESRFAGADLRGLDLCNRSLVNGHFVDADMRWCNLDRADLSGAALRGAQVCDSSLRGARLTGADASGANLRGADLQGADLQGVTFTSTVLAGCCLEGISGSPSDLRGAIVDFETWQRSRWGPVDLARWHRAGAEVLGVERFPPDAQAAIEAFKEGLTICFRPHLSGVDHMVLEAVIANSVFDVAAASVRVMEIRRTTTSTLVRIEADRPSDLEAVADAISEGVWGQENVEPDSTQLAAGFVGALAKVVPEDLERMCAKVSAVAIVERERDADTESSRVRMYSLPSDPEAALEYLLSRNFSPEELRSLLRWFGGDPPLHLMVSSGSVAPIAFAHEVVSLLMRGGHVDRALFERIVAFKPRLTRIAERTARRWEIEIGLHALPGLTSGPSKE